MSHSPRLTVCCLPQDAAVGDGWVFHQSEDEAPGPVVYSDQLGVTHRTLEEDAIYAGPEGLEGGAWF